MKAAVTQADPRHTFEPATAPSARSDRPATQILTALGQLGADASYGQRLHVVSLLLDREMLDAARDAEGILRHRAEYEHPPHSDAYCTHCGAVPAACPMYRAGVRYAEMPAECLRQQLIGAGDDQVIIGTCPEVSCRRAYTGKEARDSDACPGCGVA